MVNVQLIPTEDRSNNEDIIYNLCEDDYGDITEYAKCSIDLSKKWVLHLKYISFSNFNNVETILELLLQYASNKFCYVVEYPSLFKYDIDNSYAGDYGDESLRQEYNKCINVIDDVTVKCQRNGKPSSTYMLCEHLLNNPNNVVHELNQGLYIDKQDFSISLRCIVQELKVRASGRMEYAFTLSVRNNENNPASIITNTQACRFVKGKTPGDCKVKFDIPLILILDNAYSDMFLQMKINENDLEVNTKYAVISKLVSCSLAYIHDLGITKNVQKQYKILLLRVIQ